MTEHLTIDKETSDAEQQPKEDDLLSVGEKPLHEDEGTYEDRFPVMPNISYGTVGEGYMRALSCFCPTLAQQLRTMWCRKGWVSSAANLVFTYDVPII